MRSSSQFLYSIKTSENSLSVCILSLIFGFFLWSLLVGYCRKYDYVRGSALCPISGTSNLFTILTFIAMNLIQAKWWCFKGRTCR